MPPSKSRLQYSLFPTQSTWQPKPLYIPWANAKRVAIDLETRDGTLRKLGTGLGIRKDHYVVGISYTIEDGPGAYLPIRHEGGDNLPEEHVLTYIRDQLKTFSGEIVGANLQYEINGLASENIHFTGSPTFRDVLVADPLIYELHDSYSLNSVAQRWDFAGKDETLLREAAREYGVDPKSELWKLPARFVGAYGEMDTRLPLQVLRRQERQLDEQELWQVYNLESKVLPILAQLRIRGVRVNLERLARIEAWALAQEQEALAQVKSLCGVTVAVDEVTDVKKLVPALQAIGVKIGKTATGKPHVDKEILEKLQHPVADALLRAKKVNKLRTTFAAGVRDHLGLDGRIHSSYNQLKRQRDEDDDDSETKGAAYGRLSAEHPNLQQQPAREDFSTMWRAIYLAEENEQWAAADYSQQEPRMAVHYACKAPHLIGPDAHARAIIARNAYRNDPKTDNHQMMADMAGLSRKAAKEFYLGLSYGMGGAKMCRKLGLPTRMVVGGGYGITWDVKSPEGQAILAKTQGRAKKWEAAGVEGQALLDRFNAEVPFIKAMAKACQERAQSVGYITTISGRRCRFPRDPNGNFDWTHKALNRLIQGSSADQMKMAMVALADAGYRMILQVHDEVGLSVVNMGEAQAAAQVMLDCCPLELPSKVDIEMGESWGGSMGWREAA